MFFIRYFLRTAPAIFFFTNKTRLLMYTLFAISLPQPLLSIFCSKFLRSSPLHDAPLDKRQDLVPELVHLALSVELDDHHVVLVLRLVVLKVVVQVPWDPIPGTSNPRGQNEWKKGEVSSVCFFCVCLLKLFFSLSFSRFSAHASGEWTS